MAKVPEDEDVLWRGSWLTVRAMRRLNGRMPAKDWHDDELQPTGRAKFLAACVNVEQSLQLGRQSAGGRLAPLKASTQGLAEMRVTQQAGKPPHLRALVYRERETLWVACGFTKQKNRIERQDVTMGDSITGEWKMRRAT